MSKKDLDYYVKDSMKRKFKMEGPENRTIRMWGVSPYGNKIVVLVTFRTFPNDKEAFNTYLIAGTNYLFSNSPRLISAENVAALHLLYDAGTDPAKLDWKAILAKLADHTTASIFWIHEQQTRRHEIEQLLLDIFDDIPKSVFNSLDRATLRRPEKSTDRHPSYLMTVAPILTINDVLHKSIKVHVHNPETPDTDAMPENQKVLLEWFIGPATTALSSIVPTFNQSINRALFLIIFQTADVGQTLFVRATYVNTVGGKSKVIGDWVQQVIA